MENYVNVVTDENFSDFVSTELVLVDVFASWCGPCRIIGPIVDQISIDYKDVLSVGKLDAELNKKTVSLLKINNIPTIILYKDGQILERLVGITNRKKLKSLIDNYI